METRCSEYEKPHVFSKAFLKKHRTKGFIIKEMNTFGLSNFVNEMSRVFHASHLTGKTGISPVGEWYEKVAVEAETPEDAEVALLFLLNEYIQQNKKRGCKYLYWRRMPILKQNETGGGWVGSCRLLMSNKYIICKGD